MYPSTSHLAERMAHFHHEVDFVSTACDIVFLQGLSRNGQQVLCGQNSRLIVYN